MLFHLDLLFNMHSAQVINLAVVDSQIKLSPVTRFVNAVGNVEARTADLLSTEAALLLKLDLSVVDGGGGYREERREYDFLAGPQHALAVLIDNKRGVNWYKVSFKLVYEPAVLCVVAYLYASWHSSLICQVKANEDRCYASGAESARKLVCHQHLFPD